MAKSDFPPMIMTVEHGPKLVPANAFDAERLDTFRLGSQVKVQFVEGGDRVGIRKWWAILNRAVKDAATPWTTATQASEAIKLSLGIVDYGKTVTGQFMQWPRSLTDLDDAELDDAVRGMMDIIHKITGVDPSIWHRETPSVGTSNTDARKQDNTESADKEDLPPDRPVASGEEPDKTDGAATNSLTISPKADPEDGGVKPTAPSSSGRRQCIEKFMGVVKDNLTPQERQQNLKIAKDAWKKELPESDHGFLKAVVNTANAMILDKMTIADGRKYLESLIK